LEIKLYYSNDYVEQRLIRRLYSDSDIKIEYKDNCFFLDDYNLTYFLKENINLYKGEYISDYRENNGKSYLNFCYFGIDNIDLNQIKYNHKLYQFSQKFNIEIYGKHKDKLST
jgi:hypothetical protein